MASEEQKEKLMTELARSFPGLRSKFEDAASNGLAPWNFDLLVASSRPWSSTEKIIVSFLCEVWNVYDAKDFVPPFSAIEASRVFDKGNWSAFTRWAANPFSC